VGIPGLAVEVKFQEQLAPHQWWQQAEAQAATLPGTEPVLFYRRSRMVWRVRVRAPLEGVPCVVEFADLNAATNYLRRRIAATLAKQ
jgi:hypothetical protein